MNTVRKIDYVPLTQFLPVKFVDEDSRFTKLDQEKYLYSLTTKILVTEALELVVHKSFVVAMADVVERKAVRGKDYEIYSLWQPDGWHLQARVDRDFISEEDVINE